MRRLATSTVVSLIFRSFVVFLRCAISAASSPSLFRSSASLSCSSCPGWSGGDSYMRMNTTNTDGTSVVCFRIDIGAMRRSGYSGEGRAASGPSCTADLLAGGVCTSCGVVTPRAVPGRQRTHLVHEH